MKKKTKKVIKRKTNKGGRPPGDGYDKKKHLLMVETYLDQSQDEYKRLGADNGVGGKVMLKVKLPSIEGFSIFSKIPRSTIYDWRDTHKSFSDSLEKIMVEQKERLVNMGLAGQYNSNIAKMMLSSNHNMKDKIEQTIPQENEEPTEADIAAAEAYKEALKKNYSSRY